MLKRNRRREEEGAPLWMSTFSDLMSQLVVFFVLLFSFSSINEIKFMQFLASYQGIGILGGGVTPIVQTEAGPDDYPQEPDLPTDPILARERKMMATYMTVKNFITENRLEGMVEVIYEDKGISLDIKDSILFDSGKADLRPEAREVLGKLSDLLGELNNEIRVEGHTDNRPINTVEFPSNWELSTGRALRVIRFFIDEKKLSPERFVAVGYGEYRPLLPNTSLENMAQNRRVVIFIGYDDLILEEEVYGNAPEGNPQRRN